MKDIARYGKISGIVLFPGVPGRCSEAGSAAGG